MENWIHSIKDTLGEDNNENENKYIIILLGNKLDLAENEGRNVPIELAKEKCKEFDIIWGGECSAKDTPMEELKKQFELYTKEIFNKIGYNVARKTITPKIKKKEKTKCNC